MSIVSSVIASDSAQKDGRRWIRELHTDHVARVWERNYLAQSADDANAALSAYAILLNADIQAQEIGANVAQATSIGSLATVSLVYTTAAQNFAGLRAAYLTATQTQAIMIGDFLSARTDAQLQTAFGMTAGRVTTLRSQP